jgi:hypothetical protein
VAGCSSSKSGATVNEPDIDTKKISDMANDLRGGEL